MGNKRARATSLRAAVLAGPGLFCLQDNMLFISYVDFAEEGPESSVHRLPKIESLDLNAPPEL